jgi:hypothetical protein
VKKNQAAETESTAAARLEPAPGKCRAARPDHGMSRSSGAYSSLEGLEYAE